MKRVDGLKTNTSPVKNIIHRIRRLPKPYYAIGAVLFAVAIITGVFWPRHVTFSYAGTTCFYQPTIAPGLFRSHSDAFRLEAAQKATFGEVTVAALQMCAVPLKAPEKGTYEARLSLAGLPFPRKTYVIATPETPKAAALPSKPVSVVRSLTIPLDATDAVFDYKLASGEARTICDRRPDALACDVPKLGLKQGSKYSLRLERYFQGKRVAAVKTYDIETLTATTITASTIKAGETVFAKPKAIELTTDKDVSSASVTLVRLDGDKRVEVPLEMTRDGKRLLLEWAEDLPRQAKFELVADKVSGADGSGLEGAYKLSFETSGGPKVSRVSVGSYKVPTGATATVTFDQPLLASQDIAKVVSVSGGATVVGAKGNQLSISFAGVPRCGDVTITINDALQSEHGITGGSAWKYATRTICQVIGSIGTSVKGRSLTSYSFGSGSQTVLYTGAIHGSEASTRSLMLRWIDELEANPRSIPAGVTVTVIPALNPDGVASGGRTNARNVDLNRNFGTNDWKEDITTVNNAPFPGGGGPSAMSEPEVQAIANYVSRVRPRLVLSYHSIGGLLAANQAGDSQARASAYARLSGYSNATGASDTFEYAISGTADDYYGQVLGVPSVLIDLGSHSDPQFGRNQAAMWAMLR